MTALRIAAAFLMFGVAWILLSDRMLEAMVANHDVRATIQSIKGIAFVLLSTTLVYLLVRAAERRHAALDAQATRERDRLAQVLNVNPAVVYSLRTRWAMAQAGLWWILSAPMWSKSRGTPLPDHWLDTTTLWLDNIHPDDRALAQATQLELMRRASLSYEYRFRHADGSYRWIHDQLVLLRTDSGQPTQILGAWLDVTDRKQAEVTLHRLGGPVPPAVRANPMPMFLIDNRYPAFFGKSTMLQYVDLWLHRQRILAQMKLDDIRPPTKWSACARHWSTWSRKVNTRATRRRLDYTKNGTAPSFGSKSCDMPSTFTGAHASWCWHMDIPSPQTG
jgi:PAS domain-containing protein